MHQVGLFTKSDVHTCYVITLAGGHVSEYEPLIKLKHFKQTLYQRYLIMSALDDVLNLRYLTATWY